MRTFLAVTALGCLVLTLGALPASAGEKPQTFSLQELAERAQAGDRGARAMATETNPQGQVVLRTEFQPVDFGGRMVILNNTGATIGLFSSDSFSEGAWFLNDRFGNVRVGGLVTAESSGFLAVADSGGNTTYAMDGIQGFVSVGGDVAERFPAAGPVPPGSVLVIDPDRPGALRISDEAYDRRVAGVASGANDYKPGMTLRVVEGGENDVPVTLTGTVYCRVTSANGPIRAGDMLSTSDLPGHAMRVTDWDASRGAIVGKALEDLEGADGLILILASLQ